MLVGQSASAQMLARFPTITSDSTFLRDLRTTSRPRLLLFAEEAESPIVDSASELIKDDELAVLNLSIALLLNQNQASRGAAAALRSRFELGSDVQWAVVGVPEQLLASGQALPGAADLAQMLAAKGLNSPIKLLRDFLRANPDHISARAELLEKQLASAGRRTGSALGIEAQPSFADLIARAQREREAERASGAVPQTTTIRQVPTAIPKDKVLDAEMDLQIWAGYADTFDKLFTGDDWIAAGLSFQPNQTMYEVCSPLVKAMYGRKIGMVEAALERAPTNSNFWSVWYQMADVLGDRSIVALLGRLPQLPSHADLPFESVWPESIRGRLAKEARANGRWDVLADFLWEDFQKTMDLSTINHGYASAAGSGGESGPARFAAAGIDAAQQRRMMDSMNNNRWDEEWNSMFEPLLESLIRMNDLGRAGTIMDELQKRQQAGNWSQSQMQKAVALASRCERPDIANQWSVYVAER
jgi:hypothetical protein